jgi:Flp pilus assembly protein TadD
MPNVPHRRDPQADRAAPAFRTAFASVLLLTACGDPQRTGTPTFAEDIAPLVYSSCTPCHRPGGPTPFSLLDYDDISRRADLLAEVTQERLMPPWLPSAGDFLDDRRLSTEQIEMLRQWAAAGAPRVDRGAEPAAPTFEDGWQLGPPDRVLRLTRPLTAAADGPDVIRNYVLDIEVEQTRFVSAVEIRPGNPAVHHAVLAADETGRARQLDAADPEPGFLGMDLGGAKPPDGYFIGWTPGKQPRQSKPGMSWRLSPGMDLVLQLHLTPTGKPEEVAPEVGLYFTDDQPTVATYPLVLFCNDIDLPAGAADVVVTDEFTTPVPVTLHSVYPHAHYLCRKMTAWATPPGGSPKVLFGIDRWDFDWQDDYRLREPMQLPAGTRLSFEYRYDNSADNPNNPFDPPQRVRIGDRSTDEMANLTLQLTTRSHDDRRRLGEANIRRDLEKKGQDPILLLQLATILRETDRLEEALAMARSVRDAHPHLAAAHLELAICLQKTDRLEAAEQAYRECLRIDPGQTAAIGQFAGMLLQRGQLAPAIALYEQAIALQPGKAGLHSNLATALMAANRLPEAERQFRTATALDPELFPAWFNLGRVLAAAGRMADARQALQQALALRPGEPRVLHALQTLER